MVSWKESIKLNMIGGYIVSHLESHVTREQRIVLYKNDQ